MELGIFQEITPLLVLVQLKPAMQSGLIGKEKVEESNQFQSNSYV